MPKYQHPEAFCLMYYKCIKCGHEERVWNTRDGVTPFCITCTAPNCIETMEHIDWHMDQRHEKFVPQLHSLIFVDANREIQIANYQNLLSKKRRVNLTMYIRLFGNREPEEVRLENHLFVEPPPPGTPATIRVTQEFLDKLLFKYKTAEINEAIFKATRLYQPKDYEYPLNLLNNQAART